MPQRGKRKMFEIVTWKLFAQSVRKSFTNVSTEQFVISNCVSSVSALFSAAGGEMLMMQFTGFNHLLHTNIPQD